MSNEKNWSWAGNIKFRDDARLIDKKGNTINCDKCDKPAGFSMFGVDKSVHLCKDHYGQEKSDARIIYRQPIESKSLKNPKILNDYWEVK